MSNREEYSTNFGNRGEKYLNKNFAKSTGTTLNSVSYNQTNANLKNHSNTIKTNSQDFSDLNKSKGSHRQLSQNEIGFIDNSMEDFKTSNKKPILHTNKFSQYSEKEAKRLLTTAAMIMIDKDFKEKYEKDSQYIGVNEFSNKEIQKTIEYLRSSSEGKYFLDKYKENMSLNEMFTSTPKQYKDSNHNPDYTKGLEDNSLVFIPSTKVGQTLGRTTKEIAPVIVKKSEKAYDDIAFGMIQKANDIAPNLTNKYILNTENSLKIIGGVEIFDGYFGGNSPSKDIETFFNGLTSIGKEP